MKTIGKRLIGGATLILAACVQGLAQGGLLVNAFPNLSFTQPVLLTHAGDGTDRIFVVQQTGQIYQFPNDSSASSLKLFLNIQNKLSALGAEEGLLGLAFHPNYTTNGYFYVNYTAPNPLRTVVARYRVSQSDPDKADTTSAFIIIEINQPASNHNGGNVVFGPDGYLYIGMGDGGSGNDPNNNGQNLSVLLGKMLRIDVNDTTATTHYRIPPDNPFAGNVLGWREEIWAYGFRNPWRWSFAPVTGDLWVGDVGQVTREEVDVVVKGGNYGWKIMEGFICRPPTTGCDTTGLILPVIDYDHTLGGAVTGGYIYRGRRRPDLVGVYIYADYESGRIWKLRYSGGMVSDWSQLDDTQLLISSFGEDQDGELYLCSYVEAATSAIYRFAQVPVSVPVMSPTRPAAFALEQNFPNPFNPETEIHYQVSEPSHVRLEVFDVLGKRVATLVDGMKSPGRYATVWRGGGSASGVYLYRLTWSGGALTRSMVLAR
ncbi:MAG: PQQ-dependent sugar dehydrogenase [Bacteroidota bacterium]